MPVLASRLLEAREYLGVTREQVAGRLGWSVDQLTRLEAGDTGISGGDLRRLSRLYRRPVAWLCGETSYQPSAAELRAVEGLSEGDREAILDFAEFLHGAGPAPQRERRRSDG